MRIFALIANTAQITQELVRGFNDPHPDTLIELESCGVDDGRNLIVLNVDVHNHDRGSHLHDDFKHRLNSRGLLTPDTSTDVCGVSDVEKTAHSDRGTAFSTPTEEKNDYTFLEAVFGMSLSEEDARQKEILEWVKITIFILVALVIFGHIWFINFFVRINWIVLTAIGDIDMYTFSKIHPDTCGLTDESTKGRAISPHVTL